MGKGKKGDGKKEREGVGKGKVKSVVNLYTSPRCQRRQMGVKSSQELC